MSKQYPWYRAGLKQTPWEFNLSAKELGVIYLMKSYYWEMDKLPEVKVLAVLLSMTVDELREVLTPKFLMYWDMTKEELNGQRSGNDSVRAKAAEKIAKWRSKGKNVEEARVEEESEKQDMYWRNTGSDSLLDDDVKVTDFDDDEEL
jgi:uncharacterized protein YdaU (DUF1376 family)